MWILPNKKVVNFPRPVKINDVNHPAGIFTRWSPEELATIGIKEYKEQKVDDRFYRKGIVTAIETPTSIEKMYTVIPKYTNNVLKKQMNVKVKDELKLMFLNAKKEMDFLKEFEPTSEAIADLMIYQADLKSAYVDIRLAVLAIDDYDELVNYNWRAHYPEEVDIS